MFDFEGFQDFDEDDGAEGEGAPRECGNCGCLSALGDFGEPGTAHEASWFCRACWRQWRGEAQDEVEDLTLEEDEEEQQAAAVAGPGQTEGARARTKEPEQPLSQKERLRQKLGIAFYGLAPGPVAGASVGGSAGAGAGAEPQAASMKERLRRRFGDGIHGSGASVAKVPELPPHLVHVVAEPEQQVAPEPPPQLVQEPTEPQRQAASCREEPPPQPIAAAPVESEEFEEGDRVRLVGLATRPELNGLLGTLLEKSEARWLVRLEDEDGNDVGDKLMKAVLSGDDAKVKAARDAAKRAGVPPKDIGRAYALAQAQRASTAG